MQTEQTAPNFSDLLDKAISEPGRLSKAYFAFHGYSLGNMILAWSQCEARGIPLGPIASFNRWKELGRHVTKGQKAIELCMPITCKRKAESEGEEDATFTRFVFRRNWFVLAQTEGADYQPPTPASWDKARALAQLGIAEIPFDMLDGNCQGYAKGQSVAVSPVAGHPFKTLFHEIAHVLLGHTTEHQTMNDDERTPRTLREIEAESVAMLCCAALELPGVDDSRGYIQHWNKTGEAIPEQSARKILKTADAILRAGRNDAPKGDE